MKNRILAQQLLSGLLFIAAIVLVGWLSVQHDFKLDWTAGKRNTLTPASQKLLAAMPQPIKFTAFSYPGSEDRANIEFVVDKYKAFKNDIEIDFVDPAANPQKVRDYQVSYAGEVFVEYQGRREPLQTLDEPSITMALQRLSSTSDQWVVFIQGHGERSPEDAQSQGGFGNFAQALRDRGLKVQSVDLVQSPRIPDNTAVLVLASPTSALLPGEVKLIQDYLAGGGDLLWLSDPDTEPGLDALAADLGISWHKGFAVFADYQLVGTGDPRIFAATGYPPGPITSSLNQITLFPLVRAFDIHMADGWLAQPMLRTNDNAWSETQPLGEGTASVSLDEAAGDIPGPLTIGATLTRDAPKADAPPADEAAGPANDKPKQQRVVIVGDSDFLSNSALEQVGNRTLGLNAVQWLASRDAQIDIDVPKAPDADLFLPNWALATIAGLFTLALPLVLLVVGVGRWALRRRA